MPAKAGEGQEDLWEKEMANHTRILAWGFPDKNTEMGCHFLLQGIFLTQGLNLGLLLWQVVLYHCATWEP